MYKEYEYFTFSLLGQLHNSITRKLNLLLWILQKLVDYQFSHYLNYF